MLGVLGVLLASSPAAGAPGWERFDLGSGRYALRYEPASLEPCAPSPVVVFFHGAGGTPDGYQAILQPAADATGCVLLLPAAGGPGWSDADIATLNAALDALDAERIVDTNRFSLAGHSAGGAFAYLLGYSNTGIAGIFTLSAPAYGVDSVADPAWRSPIHMYYGTEDPNYTGGSYSTLIAQWDRLGVAHEEDIQPGYGHSTWPDSSMLAGFEFLARQVYPGTPVEGPCGTGADADADADAGADADADSGDGASPDADAGGEAAADADADLDGARDADDASPSIDAPSGGTAETGCGCRAADRPGATGPVLLAACTLALLSRRRTPSLRPLPDARAFGADPVRRGRSLGARTRPLAPTPGAGATARPAGTSRRGPGARHRAGCS